MLSLRINISIMIKKKYILKNKKAQYLSKLYFYINSSFINKKALVILTF